MYKNRYAKRFSTNETFALIDTRIKLNRYFQQNGNQVNAWKAVSKEAGLDLEPQILSKKWSNLLALYKKCLENQTNDEQLSPATWVYLERMNKWASIRNTVYKTYDSCNMTGEIQIEKGSYDYENSDKDTEDSFTETLKNSPVSPSKSQNCQLDDEVSKLLKQWGLSELTAKFKENYIVLQAFEFLTEDDIIELIPKIGQRAIFRGRLRHWRQQHGISSAPLLSRQTPDNQPQSPQPQKSPPPPPPPAEPPLKQIKLEPLDETTKPQPQCEELIKEPIQSKPKILITKVSPQNEIKEKNKTPPQLQHKVYGTLTKCSQKTVKQVPAAPVQSKVKQFYISPMVESSSPPTSPPQHHPLPFVQIPSPEVVPKIDVTPFVTSIIRVETKCDQQNNTNANVVSKQPKVNRTTILQKLTAIAPVNEKSHEKIPIRLISQQQSKIQKKTPKSAQITSEQSKTQKIAPRNRSPQQRIAQQHAQQTPQQTASHEDQTIDPSPLYPIVKLEAGLSDTESEPQSRLDIEEPDEPQHYNQPPQLEDSVEEITADCTSDETDNVAAADSIIDNENAMSKLKRIAPEIFRRGRKRQAKVAGKLDIRRVLMNSATGRHVLNYYEANEVLDVTRRRLLIDAIARDCWLSKRHLKPTDCSKIADEIIEILPNEKKEYYYCLPKGKKNFQSPLYNKYRNMNQRFFVENSIPVPIRRKKNLHLSLLGIEGIEPDGSIVIS